MDRTGWSILRLKSIPIGIKRSEPNIWLLRCVWSVTNRVATERTFDCTFPRRCSLKAHYTVCNSPFLSHYTLFSDQNFLIETFDPKVSRQIAVIMISDHCPCESNSSLNRHHWTDICVVSVRSLRLIKRFVKSNALIWLQRLGIEAIDNQS